MKLISRKLLNELIRNQFGNNQELSKEQINIKYGVKPYKREGKTWLYNVSDVNKIGIKFKQSDITKGFYPIPYFEEKFWINKDGKVLNVNNNTIVKSYIGNDMYEHITLVFYGKKYRKRVHNLMGKVFLGNPQVVNHKDNVKSNNKLYNLEPSTHSRNIKHAYDNEAYTTRSNNGTGVIATNKDTKKVYEFSSMRKAERHTGVDRHRIKRIINKENVNNTNWEFEFK